MRTPLIIAAAAASLSLAACNNEPETVDTRAPDPMASQLANAAPVELPPPLKASVTFRCQPGNTLAYVDFFQGDKQANVRLDQNDAPTRLTAPEAGQPLTAEGGWSLEGNEQSITLTAPNQGTKQCKA